MTVMPSRYQETAEVIDYVTTHGPTKRERCPPIQISLGQILFWIAVACFACYLFPLDLAYYLFRQYIGQ